MSLKFILFVALAGFLALLGYLVGAIVVPIYAALGLGLDKMALESGIAPHLFSTAGALSGIGLAWLIVLLASALLRPRRASAVPGH